MDVSSLPCAGGIDDTIFEEADQPDGGFTYGRYIAKLTANFSVAAGLCSSSSSAREDETSGSSSIESE